MAEKPISLSRVRKARARAERRAQADANATLHGLSGAEKRRLRAEAAEAARRIDGHRRDGGGPGTNTGSNTATDTATDTAADGDGRP